jgi:hypothetical protein
MMGRKKWKHHTSPPPTTSTFFPLICHAKIKLPPGCTTGNVLAMMSFFGDIRAP